MTIRQQAIPTDQMCAVYRWRKLEGSDPSTFEMIQKIQTLQKRLITKTEEVVERDLLIQEKEKLYVELKNILARQPGPEVAEQLSTYQANIREKNKQMKSMASELNTHQAQVRLDLQPGSGSGWLLAFESELVPVVEKQYRALSSILLILGLVLNTSWLLKHTCATIIHSCMKLHRF